jgi:hypothetical protein
MSRRNQSRRRRTYGRRQHELRERRPSDDMTRPNEWPDHDSGADATAHVSAWGELLEHDHLEQRRRGGAAA